MAPTKVIRIDEQVWAELQKRARPLEDTPNSVLRRVFGLPEDGSPGEALDAAQGYSEVVGNAAQDQQRGTGEMDSRVVSLLESVQQLTGHAPEVKALKKGYAFLSGQGRTEAYVRVQRKKLRVSANKERAEQANLNHWDEENADGWLDKGVPSVRWYIDNGDALAYRRVAEVLSRLYRLPG